MSGDASSVIGYDHRSACVGSAKMAGYPGGMRMADAVSPLLVLQARAEARAILYAAGELTLQDAVDGSQRAAEAYGLVAKLGQDAVQEIIAEAFAPFRDDMVPDLIEDGIPRTGTAESTLAAAEYLLKQNDVPRWREWLAKHGETERADILKRIKRRQLA
jgi:hypothetical protein